MEEKTCAFSQYTDYLQSETVSQKMAGWTDIVDIVSGPDLTVVLRRDGTVDFVCANAGYASEYDDMLEWTDIVAIDGLGVIGCIAELKSDGTVMAGKLPNDVAFPDVTNMKDLYVPAIVTDGL